MENRELDRIELGWDESRNQHFEQYRSSGLIPARVAAEHRERYSLLCEAGELSAEVSGRFQFTALGRSDYPAVGDWVAVAYDSGGGVSIIQAVLPRRTCFSRKAVLAGGKASSGGQTEEQVLAANVDTVFLVSGLDHDFKIRRIERYLAVAWESGSLPVIVLNKADVCANVEKHIETVGASAPGVAVHPMIASDGEGVEQLRQYLTVGKTIALLGSSGVGKSTIINRLCGFERQDTGGVRLDDSKGRHTTTKRELILIPEGGMVIDTPGMRQIKLWDDETGLHQSFADVEQLIAKCRFADCQHNSEPGCAVREAIETGELDPGRLQNYLKMGREVEALRIRKNVREERQANRDRDKRFRRFHRERELLRKNKLI